MAFIVSRPSASAVSVATTGAAALRHRQQYSLRVFSLDFSSTALGLIWIPGASSEVSSSVNTGARFRTFSHHLGRPSQVWRSNSCGLPRGPRRRCSSPSPFRYLVSSAVAPACSQPLVAFLMSAALRTELSRCQPSRPLPGDVGDAAVRVHGRVRPYLNSQPSAATHSGTPSPARQRWSPPPSRPPSYSSPSHHAASVSVEAAFTVTS